MAGDSAAGGPRRGLRRGAARSAASSGAKNISPQWTPDGRSLFFLSDRRRHHEHLSHASSTAAADAADQPPHRRQRHHRAQPGAVGRRQAAWCSAPTRTTATTSTRSRLAAAARGRRHVRSAAECRACCRRAARPRGRSYAALDNETAGAAGRDTPPQPRTRTTSRSSGSTSPASRRSVSASIRSAPMPPAACRSSSATCSAITRRDVGAGHQPLRRVRRQRLLLESDAPLELGRRRSIRRRMSRAASNAASSTRRGQQSYVEQEYRILQTDRSASGLISYPFSRAQRIEVIGRLPPDRPQAGRHDADVRLQLGQQISAGPKRTLSTYPNLNLGEASAALVYDTSICGVTSPIRGSRYRVSSCRRRRVADATPACSPTGAPT